jgi:hypothetical protein
MGMWAGLGLSLRMMNLTKLIGKIVEAWQMFWFRSLIKIGEPVLRMICEASLLLLLVLRLDVVVSGMLRRDGLLLAGAGEGDLQERCLGSCLRGD